MKPDEVGGYGNGSGGWFWMGSQPFLKVNLKGERFMSESVPYDYVLQAALSQPDHTWCTVWDSNLVEDIYRFKTQGCSRYFEFENGAPPQIPLAAVMGMNEGLVADGFIQQADTVEELAEKLDIPADASLPPWRATTNCTTSSLTRTSARKPTACPPCARRRSSACGRRGICCARSTASR